MTAEKPELQVFQSDDGLLVWGPSASMALFDAAAERAGRPLSPTVMGRLGRIVGAAADLSMESGRYVRLDDESYALVKAMGVKDLGAGVLRRKDAVGGKGGQIVKHLKFSTVTTPGPLMAARLAAMATEASVQQSIDALRDYLEEMDQKLDRLMRQRKLEITGQLGGVVLAIEEAEAVQSSTGAVSDITWSKVQTNSLTLQQVQAEAIAQLAALADEILRHKDDVDDLARVIRRETEGVQFWLGVLARAVTVQDRQHLLELARVEAQHPEQLEAHRRGLVAARSHRLGRITDALRRINESLVGAGTLTNLGYVANPLSSRAVTRGSEEITGHVMTFATHADVDLENLGRVEGKAWLTAVRGLAGDVKSGVDETASTAVRGVSRFGRGLKSAGEERALARAERIRARRALAGEADSAGGGTDPED